MSSSTPLNSKDLQRIFNALDQNQDGRLSLDELNWLLEKTGVLETNISPEDLVSLVGKELENGLDFDEFFYLYHHSILKNSTGKLVGREENGEEDEEEEEEDIVVNDGVEDEESYYLYKAFKVFDANGDGYISSEEVEKVLLRLGLWNQNHDHEMDCQRSIRAFDINSDGYLDFEEFKAMMLAVQ